MGSIYFTKYSYISISNNNYRGSFHPIVQKHPKLVIDKRYGYENHYILLPAKTMNI